MRLVSPVFASQGARKQAFAKLDDLGVAAE
jgi:hypothetical protein